MVAGLLVLAACSTQPAPEGTPEVTSDFVSTTPSPTSITSPAPSTTVLIEAELGLDVAPMVNRGSFDFAQESGYPGPEDVHFDIHVVDINTDGFDDLVFTPMFLESVAKPVAHIFDPDSGRFTVDYQFLTVVPAMQHPRELGQIDVDGDGRLDLFFANHGYDDAPWGEPNALLLNTAGGFIDASDLLPQVNDYTHGVIIADLFDDGFDDVITLNSLNIRPTTKCEEYPGISTLVCGPGAQEGNSYVLSNTGTGSLNRVVIDADLNFTPNSQPRLSKGNSQDLNGDGLPDLVVTFDGLVTILESQSAGSYVTRAMFTLSMDDCVNDAYFGDVLFNDLDDDGEPEVLTFETCNWGSMVWRVFDRASSGEWSDISGRLFPGRVSDATDPTKRWCLGIWIVDIDHDGDDDIVCNSRSGRPDAFWLRTDGMFENTQFPNMDEADPRGGETLVVRLGGEVHVLSIAGFRVRSWRVG